MSKSSLVSCYHWCNSCMYIMSLQIFHVEMHWMLFLKYRSWQFYQAFHGWHVVHTSASVCKQNEISHELLMQLCIVCLMWPGAFMFSLVYTGWGGRHLWKFHMLAQKSLEITTEIIENQEIRLYTRNHCFLGNSSEILNTPHIAMWNL